MNKVIIDANILLTVGLNLPDKAFVIRATEGCELVAPTVLPFEIGNALSAMVRRSQLDAMEASQAFHKIQNVFVRQMNFNLEKVLNIAYHHVIYAYDAYYLQLAIETNIPLLTLDKGMKRVAKSLSIQLIEENQDV